MDVPLVGPAARRRVRDISLVGGGPRPSGGEARRPSGARGRGRSAQGRRRRGPAGGGASARRHAAADRPRPAPPARLVAWRPRRDDPAPAPRARVVGARLASHGRSRARGRVPRGGDRLPDAVGRPTRAACVLAGHAARDRSLAGRPCGARRAHELAARPRSRPRRRDGSTRRPPQRLDPRLGRARAAAPADPFLPGADLPSAARHARAFREPDPARRALRAVPVAGRPGARVQHGAPRKPHRLGPRRPAPGPARERRPLRRLRGRSDVRGRRPPLDPPRAPACAGHAVPSLRPARPRPFLGETDAAPGAHRGPVAGAAGPVVDLPRRDHGPGAGVGGGRGPLRGAERARPVAPGGGGRARRADPFTRGAPIYEDALLLRRGVVDG